MEDTAAAAAAATSIRQNFDSSVEAELNKQINRELHASYVYAAMGCYFSRHDVAFAGFSRWFFRNGEEERDHSRVLMDYVISRGGKVTLKDVERPRKMEWPRGPAEAVTDALKMEKEINEALIGLHRVASDHADPHLTDFIEEKFLTEQVGIGKKK